MTKKQKKNLKRIIISGIILIALEIIFRFIEAPVWIKLICYLIPYFIVGLDILKKALKGIKNKQAMDENLLMTVATVGAFILAVINNSEFTEAIAVMLFYQIGEFFQSYAVGKSRKNISELMDIRPDYANLVDGDSVEKTDPDNVEIGSIIQVGPGEKIPIDGVVVEGEANIDTVALTGESVPVRVGEGSDVLSGSICTDSVIKIRTTSLFSESTATKILELVENASSRKSRSENFISKFAAIYTPVVVYLALALMIIPPVVRILFLKVDPLWLTWIYRALTFLVISCPCALVISIPLTFFAGLGGASREGILIKGSNYLEALSYTKIVVFDKTGTLTEGVFRVTAIHPQIISEEELLHLAAHVERYSSHPIANSLKLAYKHEDDGCSVEDVKEISGKGIKAVVNNKEIYVGNTKLMDSVGVKFRECSHQGTIVHVAIDGEYVGHIVISDVVKENSFETIKKLKEMGMKKIVMLTGDVKKVAEKVADTLDIDYVYSELLPGDKVEKIEELIKEKKEKEGVTFVGDGINDAPVLTRSDVGIAMGAMGVDAAIEAADVVIMDDNPEKVVKAIKISKKCVKIVYQNIYFAIGIKVLCLILGAVGIANMWLAIFADVGVMIIAVLNAIRALFVSKL